MEGLIVLIVILALPYLAFVRLLWNLGSFFSHCKFGSNHYLEIRHLPDENE